MTGVDKNPLAMNYVSVSSWYGNTATYKLDFTISTTTATTTTTTTATTTTTTTTATTTIGGWVGVAEIKMIIVFSRGTNCGKEFIHLQ